MLLDDKQTSICKVECQKLDAEKGRTGNLFEQGALILTSICL
jgi:hypothetical protein